MNDIVISNKKNTNHSLAGHNNKSHYSRQVEEFLDLTAAQIEASTRL